MLTLSHVNSIIVNEKAMNFIQADTEYDFQVGIAGYAQLSICTSSLWLINSYMQLFVV